MNWHGAVSVLTVFTIMWWFQDQLDMRVYHQEPATKYNLIWALMVAGFQTVIVWSGY